MHRTQHSWGQPTLIARLVQNAGHRTHTSDRLPIRPDVILRHHAQPA